MDTPNDPIHSFIVRIWLEECADDSGPAIWRGHITHTLSRERIYFTDLREILPFIASYLPGLALEPRPREHRWRWWRWRRPG
jgi:hypothetical protein